MKRKNTDIIMQNKIFTWIALATCVILSIPLIAMQFKSDVNWELSDFIIMGVLLFGMGSAFVLVARKFRDNFNRVLIGFTFLLLFIYIWAELAVGIFTNLGS